MRNTLNLLAACLCALLSSAQRISIQPSILDFHLGANVSQTQAVTITNLSDKKLVFEAYLADWLRDSTGGHHYFRPDTLSRSCATWVTLNKSVLELEPDQSAEVFVHLQTPADTSGLTEMKWAMLFLQTVGEQEAPVTAATETPVKEIIRVGVHIYETPPTVTRSGAKAVSFSPLASEKDAYELILKNTGGAMLHCKAYLKLTSVADGTLYNTEKMEFPVFPDGVRRVKLTLPAKLPKGKYAALAVLDPGSGLPLQTVQEPVEVK